jgi:hypothetical protein
MVNWMYGNLIMPSFEKSGKITAQIAVELTGKPAATV